jgi:4-hydroxybenzoate polyprenyl transferase
MKRRLRGNNSCRLLIDNVEDKFTKVKQTLQNHPACHWIIKKWEPISEFIANNPYCRLMRLNMPVGIALLLFPVWWAIAFASHSIWEALWAYVFFGVGAVIMRSAGCIINDLADMKIDRQVARTLNRPLASGELTIKQALCLLASLLGIALLMLFMLPKVVIIIGALSMIPIILYPFIKRLSYYPQVFLGITFNIGVLMAWLTLNERAFVPSFMLYIASIFWTIGYDTIYACQDAQDDAPIGVKSMALRFGHHTPDRVWQLYKLSLILLGLLGINTHLNIFFYIALGIATYHMYWQTSTLDYQNPKDCAGKFCSNVQLGWTVLIGILIGQL